MYNLSRYLWCWYSWWGWSCTVCWSASRYPRIPCSAPTLRPSPACRERSSTWFSSWCWGRSTRDWPSFSMTGVRNLPNVTLVQKGPYNLAKATNVVCRNHGDEHIFKLKIQKGTWSYLLSRWRWITLLFFFTRRHKFGPKGLFALTRHILPNLPIFLICVCLQNTCPYYRLSPKNLQSDFQHQ